jgi:hypothetical protein
MTSAAWTAGQTRAELPGDPQGPPPSAAGPGDAKGAATRVVGSGRLAAAFGLVQELVPVLGRHLLRPGEVAPVLGEEAGVDPAFAREGGQGGAGGPLGAFDPVDRLAAAVVAEGAEEAVMVAAGGAGEAVPDPTTAQAAATPAAEAAAPGVRGVPEKEPGQEMAVEWLEREGFPFVCG